VRALLRGCWFKSRRPHQHLGRFIPRPDFGKVLVPRGPSGAWLRAGSGEMSWAITGLITRVKGSRSSVGHSRSQNVAYASAAGFPATSGTRYRGVPSPSGVRLGFVAVVAWCRVSPGGTRGLRRPPPLLRTFVSDCNRRARHRREESPTARRMRDAALGLSGVAWLQLRAGEDKEDPADLDCIGVGEL
jgi:hypothetical protein